MVHLFNRKELLMTWDMQQAARVRNLLSTNGIDYCVRTVNSGRKSSSIGRGRISTAGLNTDVMIQYYIYVRRMDYSQARILIGR